MRAKEYLRQYEDLDKKARYFKEEYELETEKIDAIGSTLGGEPGMPHGTGISRKTEDRAIRLADAAMKWKIAELDAIEKRQEVVEVISKVRGIEGEVLYQRYIALYKWEQICVNIPMSWTGVHKAHRRALAIVQSMLDD